MPTNRRSTVRASTRRRQRVRRAVAAKVARTFDARLPAGSIYQIVEQRMKSAYMTLGAALTVQMYLDQSTPTNEGKLTGG